MFRAEKMKPTDFQFAVDLANTLGWDMANVDFEYMLSLEPDGCFVLSQDEERVGMATCVGYGKIGWFGNLAVKPEFRRKGAGTFLVKHAVQYLRSNGVETIGLYAYQHLAGFYRKVGFQPLDDFVVLNGIARKTTSRRGAATKVGTKDIPALIEIDANCMGWNRRKLFDSVFHEEGSLCYYSAANGEIRGFVMAKVYGEMAEIGPLMCGRDPERFDIGLIETMLAELEGLDVYAYAPANETEILDLLLQAGLREKFRVTRMFLGSVAAESCVYMPESLERG
jgi:ribosomal protein S18 acetylase RimI-like enzyme